MLELYYRPFACSLASRIALEEAGLEATYHAVDLTSKRLADGGDYRAVSPKGQVPALRTEDGALVTEGPAVLQYIADRRPEAGLAPAPGDPLRTELHSWLNFVATELHQAFLIPKPMSDAPDAVREYGRARFEGKLPVVVEHLRHHDYLVGDRFSVADGYMLWALTLARFAGVELPEPLPAYLARLEARPAVARALARERAEMQAAPAAAAGGAR